MESHKKIIEDKNNQFRDLQLQEKEEMEALKRTSLHWKVLDDAIAQIKAEFEKRRKILRDDHIYKQALIRNFTQNLYQDWEEKKEETNKAAIPAEITRPEEWDEKNKIKLVCPKCGETNHEPGAKFCHVCGSNLGADEPSHEKEDEKQKKSSKNRRRKNRRGRNKN